MNENAQNLIGEINALKSLLSDTDHQLYKMVEGLSDCDTITGVVALFRDFRNEYGEMIANRRAWRSRINEAEAALAELEEDQV